MPTMAHQEPIAHILQQQIDAAGGLQNLLTQERAALEGRDMESFNRIVAQKQTLISELDDLERSRNKQVQQAGYSGEPENFDEYLRAEDHGKKLTLLSDQLREVLGECFKLNRINAGMVELSYHYLNQSLAVLRGTEGPQKNTYGPQGKPIESGDSQRTIAKV